MDRPIDIDLTKNTDTTIHSNEPTPAELQEFRSRMVSILDRSNTVDHTIVQGLPAELDDYWCPNDAQSVLDAERRGYKPNTQYGKSPLNDRGDGKLHFVDTIHMIRPKWMKTEEKRLINKRYVEDHIKDRRKLKEERDFESSNRQLGMQSIINSTSETVTGSDIAETLNPNKG